MVETVEAVEIYSNNLYLGTVQVGRGKQNETRFR